MTLPRVLSTTVTALFFSNLPFSVATTTQSEYVTNICEATNTLNSLWYNGTSGLWDNWWWNSANVATALVNIAPVASNNKPTIVDQVGGSGTFTKAKAFNGGSFLNDFYDDEGWWALSWLRTYDMTQNTDYLNAAEVIFEDLLIGNNATCGGHWWDKAKTYNAVIANELYLSVAASLANRVPAKKSYYQGYAQDQADWFLAHAPFTPNNTLMDGLTLDCQASGSVFSYNQGVILGALVEMNKLTGNTMYLDRAEQIARGAMEVLVDDDGILSEIFYAPGDTNGPQFKGIFVRNLVILHAARPDNDYVSFLQRNADAIWAKGRDAQGRIGFAWQGPNLNATTDFSVASHSSGIDCLIAAATVTLP